MVFVGPIRGIVSYTNGPTDPLAGVTFALRLQTHVQGSNTPVGLFKDTACTIPATTAGDLIKGWKDVLGTSALAVIQATDANCPTLQFSSGVPVVRFDGLAQFMALGTSISAQPLTAFSGTTCTTGGAVDQRIFDAFSTVRCLLGPQNGGTMLMFAGAAGPNVAQSFPLAASQFTGIFNGASSILRKNGSQIGTGDVGAGDLTSGITVGATIGGGEYFAGDMTSLFIKSGVATAPELALIEAYQPTLF